MKKQMPKKEKVKKHYSKRITLIAHVITIIVLLILAGVSIAMLTGENGVLTKATEAKDQTEIAQEKEEIQMAYAAAKANKVEDVADPVTADELNTELDKLNSKGETSGSGTLTVTFSDSQRKYTINQSTGAISDPITDDTEEDEDKKAIKMIVNSGEDGIVVLPFDAENSGTISKINWGDGKIETISKSEYIEKSKIASIKKNIKVAAYNPYSKIYHKYEEKNKEIEVEVDGDIKEISSSASTIYYDKELGRNIYYDEGPNKIIEITQWGETGLTNIYLGGCTKLRKIASPSENSFINITNFVETFWDCENLTSIPEDLFSNCPNVTYFNGTFSGCTNLTGEAVPLWERVDGWESLDFKNAREWIGTKPDGNACYMDCTKLSNYSSIPDYWKDGYSE